MPLEPPDPLPQDLVVLDSAGERHRLAATTGGEALLLIYLRHLG